MSPSRSTTGTERRRSPVTLPSYRLGKPPANKGRTFKPEPLTREEMHRLLAACSRTSPGGQRMAALIVVLWRGGLRISEALDLEPKDVDLAAGTIRVLHGKRDKDRIVAIDPQACAVIERWLQCRARLRIPSRLDGEPTKLFCNILRPMRGGRLWDSTVRGRLKELGEKAGIEKRVHPHGLRHTHAFELRMERVDMIMAQQQLGHTRLETTARYMDHLAPAERIAALNARRWDGKPTARTPDMAAELAKLNDVIAALRSLGIPLPPSR